MNVTVIGSGSWGTAFGRLLALKGHDVQVLTLTADEAAELASARVNTRFLPGVALPDSIRFVALGEADLAGTELIAYVVPTQAVREVATWVAARRPPARCRSRSPRGSSSGR